jgi:hypothetical protein
MDVATLGRRLAALPHRHQAAFAAKCSERVLPIVSFEGGDPTAAKQAVALVWAFATGGQVNPDLLDQSYEVIESLIPDQNEQSGMTATMMSYLAIIAAIESVVDRSGSAAAQAATCAIDAVDALADYCESTRYDTEVEWQSSAIEHLQVTQSVPVDRHMFSSLGDEPPAWSSLIRRPE